MGNTRAQQKQEYPHKNNQYLKRVALDHLPCKRGGMPGNIGGERLAGHYPGRIGHARSKGRYDGQ